MHRLFVPRPRRTGPALADVFIAACRGGYRGVVPDDVIDGLDAAELAATCARRVGTPGRYTVVEGVAAARQLAATATAGPLAHDPDAGWWVQ